MKLNKISFFITYIVIVYGVFSIFLISSGIGFNVYAMGENSRAVNEANCYIHWIQLALFVSFEMFMLYWYFVMNKTKLDIVSITVISVFVGATIILSLFGDCEICTISLVLNLIAAGISIFSFLFNDLFINKGEKERIGE